MVISSEGRTIAALDAAERIKLRPALLASLAETGMVVFRVDVRGHTVAVLIPGETEVLAADSNAVWDAVVAELELAIEMVRKTGVMARGGDS